jgi:hypothetical protein
MQLMEGMRGQSARATKVLDGRKPSEEIWLSASQGWRGSIPALSGAGSGNQDALETWPSDNEINNLKHVERRTWRICNNSKNQS